MYLPPHRNPGKLRESGFLPLETVSSFTQTNETCFLQHPAVTALPQASSLPSPAKWNPTALPFFHLFPAAAAATAAFSGFSYSISHALFEQFIPTVAIKKTLKKVLLRASDSRNWSSTGKQKSQSSYSGYANFSSVSTHWTLQTTPQQGRKAFQELPLPSSLPSMSNQEPKLGKSLLSKQLIIKTTKLISMSESGFRKEKLG